MDEEIDFDLTEILNTIVDNATSVETLEELKDGLLDLFSEDNIVDIDTLVNDYSIEELREMGIDI